MLNKNISTVTRVSDPLAIYYAEIRKYPRLTIEEEKELGQRKATGDDSAKAYLINCSLRLVASIAQKYARNSQDTLDYIQEGTLGLISAVEIFDYNKGRLSTIAVPRIRRYINNFRNQDYTLLIKRNKQEHIRKVKEYTTDMLTAYNREPTLSEIATMLGVGQRAAQSTLAVMHTMKVVSLDSPTPQADNSEEALLIDLYADNRYPANIFIVEQSQKLKQQLIAKLFDILPEQQKQIMELRYDFKQQLVRTQKEVVPFFNYTAQNISLIEQKALAKIRQAAITKTLAELYYNN